MSTNDQQQDTRSPEEIEADINETRSHLDDTLSDFQSRFSSDSMMNTAMDYVKSDSAKEYFSNLGRSVKENPVPAAMIGLGIGWLMYSSNSSNRSVPSGFNDKRQAQARHAAVETTPQTHEYDAVYNQGTSTHQTPPPGGPGAYAFGPGSDATDSTSNSTDGLRQRAGDAFGTAGDKARNIKSGAGDHMSRMKQSSSEQLHNASSKARDTGNWLNQMAHDNPVAAGAIGLAAGALLGSLLPSTRTEQRAMGDTRDQLVNKAAEAGSEQLNRASDKAQEKTDKYTSDDNDGTRQHDDSERTTPSATSGTPSTPGSNSIS